MKTPDVSEQVLKVVRHASAELAGTEHQPALDTMAQRLVGPLRVAIAGRIKAGKSTLLNALVGARLAPTNASECTKIVSAYRNGQLYQVEARLHDGSTRQLPFVREEGALDVQLGDLAERDIEHLDISWPSSKLEHLTLIDTPGLESLNDENSRRTRDFLEVETNQPSDVDAVIYLMRHLHTTDVAFLDAYLDRSVPESSPVNAVAVLSRADEIGAGRLDSMQSAAKIAERYRRHGEVRSLASTVIPLAGLLAETGLTLREGEVATLRSIAEQPEEVRAMMLVGASNFCDVHTSDITVEVRRELLARFGMFGVRLAIQEVLAGADTATTLAPILVRASGLNRLNQLINEQFLARARIFQSRSVLGGLRSIAGEIATTHPELARHLDGEVERIESSAIEFAQMRAAHLIAAGTVHLRESDAADVERMLLGRTPADQVGLPATATPDDLRTAVGAEISRWRSKANDRLQSASAVEVYEAAARTAEAAYMNLTASA